ncbi:MAG TPA: Gfo/Idh/MocA family oxidoreductase [Vicinamibacterales bacterium]
MTEQDEPQQPNEPSGLTRRDFMNKTAVAGAGLVIVPRHVLGRGMQAPSDTVNIATVGVSGMGSSNTNAVLSQNIVAFCDVDYGLLDARIDQWKNPPPPRGGGAPAAAQGRGNRRPQREPTPAQLAANEKRPRQDQAANMKRFVEVQLPKIQRYRDYREMLDKQKDIDGIIVATPDHMHAAIASAAMDVGKHVYVQKPLCWSVDEARTLAKKAKDHPKLVTQMGNQGHSRDEARLGYEYINSGAIGEIREVHVWTNRPFGYWPQGVPRPAPLPPRLQDPDVAAKRWRGADVDAKIAAWFQGGASSTPSDQLSWDLFLGVAPPVEYHPIYHPFNWRGWVDWGQGALGDMGAHLIDHPFWSLKLGMPTVIETRSTPFNGASFPTATTTYYEFPSRGNLPAVKLTWYDGGLTPPKPAEIGDENLNGEGGIIYIGSKGKMMQETYGLNPRLLPDSKHASTPRPKQILPRIPHEAHEMNWVDAIRGHQEASSPFEYATALTEVMLLGIVSLRAGGKIHYDAANRRITNKIVNENSRDGDIDPNQFLSREYRPGWTL